MYGSLFKCVKLSTFKKAYFDQVCIHMNLCRIDYKPKLTQIWLEFASKERIKNVSTLCVFSYLTKFVKEKISFHSSYSLNNIVQFNYVFSHMWRNLSNRKYPFILVICSIMYYNSKNMNIYTLTMCWPRKDLRTSYWARKSFCSFLIGRYTNRGEHLSSQEVDPWEAI